MASLESSCSNAIPYDTPLPASADVRTLHGAALAEALRDSRARTWRLVSDLSDAQWRMPRQPGVNPVAWELAHLAWFAEFWVLRGPHRRGDAGRTEASGPARLAGPDAHFDSARLAHAARWDTPLPSRQRLETMLRDQLDACLAAIDAAANAVGNDDAELDAALYFPRLALFHEDMHAEAFTWLRSALGYAAPAGAAVPPLTAPAAALAIAGDEVRIGRPVNAPGFAFDNEQPARELRLHAYEIDSAPLSAGAFMRFVNAGGYDRADCWPGAAGAWRATFGRDHPQRWRRAAPGFESRDAWEVRWFDRWLPLAPDSVLMHVNAFEAEAYCRWAGRRLPSAAEWEHAAPRLRWGRGVWEWTADRFEPYPGFVAGPYMEYSAPWFGNHRELRGGAFATHERLHDRRYRNFFMPERNDVFAGFRTASG